MIRWPFMSPLGKRQRDDISVLDQDDDTPSSPYCECDLQVLEIELDRGKCSCCGKQI